MRKKILIISSTPFFGGAEQFIISTLTKLDPYYELYYFIKDAKVEEQLTGRHLFKTEKTSLLGQYKDLKLYIAKCNPDILLFNGSNIAYNMPLFRSYKKIYYRHTTNLYAPKQRRWMFRLIMDKIYRSADLSIHVSEYSLTEQKAGKGICIHNGIVSQHGRIGSNRPSEPLKVLFCSRLEKAKGIHEIITAFNHITPDTAQLTIIGTGSECDWVKENIGNSIKYLGFQTDVAKFYRDADVMILMSEFENFPISIIEAMSYGLPIITTGAGGISEMVKDGFNCLFIKSSQSEIINEVNTLNSNREILKEMSNNSQKFCMEHLNLNDKAEEIHQAIESVLNNENRDRL